MNSSRSKVQKISSKGLSVGTWTPAEDGRLTEAVAKHGPRWVLVAGDVGTRNGDQCAKRWNENLNPELDHSPWCPAEDRTLLHLVELYGHKWKFIANRFFEKRSPLSLKNRNSYLERRQRREEQQGRSSQRSGQQSPFDPLTPTALTTMPDAPINIPATFPLGPHEYFGDGSSHSSSPSMTGTDMARLQSRCSSSTDMAEFMGPMPTINTTGKSPTPDQGGDMMMVAHPPLQENSMGHMAEQVDWHRFMDNLDPFGHPTGDENTIRILGTNSDGIVLPMLDANDPALPHTQPYGASTGIDLDGTVEYSLTCPRDKVKSLVQHLVDAAMPGTVTAGMADEQQVMLSLRLKGL